MESVPVSPSVVHGVPLTDLLARCHSMAQRFYRKQGRFEPFEEYLSAGHLAIAQCIHTYDPTLATSGGFLSYCVFQMEMKMRGVRYAAAGSHNMPKHKKGVKQEPKYAVESVDDTTLFALHSQEARQESVTYLHEIEAWLLTQGTPAAMLFATVADTPQEDIAQGYGCSVENIKKHCVAVRKKLRVWCVWSVGTMPKSNTMAAPRSPRRIEADKDGKLSRRRCRRPW